MKWPGRPASPGGAGEIGSRKGAWVECLEWPGWLAGSAQRRGKGGWAERRDEAVVCRSAADRFAEGDEIVTWNGNLELPPPPVPKPAVIETEKRPRIEKAIESNK